jgi:outer membrane protein assembly factor BamB
MARRRTLGAALVALVIGALPVARANAITVQVKINTAACNATDWPMFGHDMGRSFASPDTCITAVTAAALVPKWYFHTGSPVTAQPAVVGGVVYVGDFSGTMHAVDASSGVQLWSFSVTPALDNEKTDYGKIPGSAAVATVGNGPNQKQVLVFGAGDTLIALDASDPQNKTKNRFLSSVCVDRVDPTCQGGAGHTSEIESSPVVVPHIDGAGNALVVVGTDVNEADPSGPLGVIGFVLSPQGTLTPKWQFDPETGVHSDGLAPLDPGEHEHGCGDVWSSPAVDISGGIDHGVVVFGTGNCDAPDVTPGVTQPVESTFAVDLLTGRLLWQATPHPVDNHLDLDFGATPNVLGGGLVGEAGKDGAYWVYTLTGTPVWHVQAATPSAIGGFIGSTAVGKLGALHGNHAAVFGASSIPISPNDPQGSITNDITHPTQAFGVHAIDTVTHKVVWDAPLLPVFGAAAYNNGLVYVPDTVLDSLVVLDADTGVPVRIQPLDAPPASPVAISGNSVYFGSGTTQDAPPLSLLSSFGGIWAFHTPL